MSLFPRMQKGGWGGGTGVVDFPNSPCCPGAQIKLKIGSVFGAVSSLSLHPQMRTWRLLGEEFFFFLVVLGVCCYKWAFSRCGKWGLLSRCVVGASNFSGFSCWWTKALKRVGFSSCRTQAYLLHGICNLPGPGIKPMSSALAGGLLSTVPWTKS